jgi:5,10-methylenetetrahydromethanopterin reductase
MDFGICVASRVTDIDYIVRAEQRGYSHAWLADSQMIWSDCYAALALAAVRTSTINLGTGVAVSGTRSAPVNAASIATINQLAPGRTFFGIGTGNTAMRVMGQAPHRIRQFDEYLDTLGPLLRGEEAEFEGKSIRHIMPDDGFVNFSDPIPLYISGFAPRSLGLAGKHGDGAVLATLRNPGVLENLWSMIEAGANTVGRVIERNKFYMTALTAIVILEPGEKINSPRVKHECGAMGISALHYAYDQFRNFGKAPPNWAREVWGEYCELLDKFPAEKRHQRIHAGHSCWVLPEEEKFLTEPVLKASSMIGTRDQLIERLSDLKAAGLDQIMMLPNFDPRFEVLEKTAKALIGHI